MMKREYVQANFSSLVRIVPKFFHHSWTLIGELVSADPQTRDACRYFALEQKKKIDYFETDFQPAEADGGFWAPGKGTSSRVMGTLWAAKATTAFVV